MSLAKPKDIIRRAFGVFPLYDRRTESIPSAGQEASLLKQSDIPW